MSRKPLHGRRPTGTGRSSRFQKSLPIVDRIGGRVPVPDRLLRVAQRVGVALLLRLGLGRLDHQLGEVEVGHHAAAARQRRDLVLEDLAVATHEPGPRDRARLHRLDPLLHVAVPVAVDDVEAAVAVVVDELGSASRGGRSAPAAGPTARAAPGCRCGSAAARRGAARRSRRRRERRGSRRRGPSSPRRCAAARRCAPRPSVPGCARNRAAPAAIHRGACGCGAAAAG